MKESFDTNWVTYLETPRGQDGPVKLDAILAARMAAFLKARTVKPFRRIR